MKKYTIATLALLATATASMAQVSGSITIQGTVSTLVSITVSPIAGYNTLDIANGVTGRQVADVTEKCNHQPGYTVTMTSLNAAGSGSSLFLAAGGGITDTVPYTLTYNGAAVTVANGAATLTDTTGKTTNGGVVKALAVTIPPSFVAEATYADTLTFTIAAK